jgi:uncharacterized membrane protein
MPYCTQCGGQVRDVDIYCAKCGGKQGAPAAEPRQAPTGAHADMLAGVSPRTASLCCYLPVIGWIPCIVVLASAKFRHDRDVRFHAFQGLYLFVLWLILDWVVGPMMGSEWVPAMAHISQLLKVAVIIAWVFMLVKLSQGQSVRLPIIGDLAERSVAEQRS